MLNPDGVLSLYEAAVEQARFDMMEAKKNAKKGYPDTHRGRYQEGKDIETLTECTRFLFSIGFKDKDISKALDKMDDDVDRWYVGWRKAKARKAGRDWLAWGMCLDDDVY
jgi:hypothetical protein